MSTPVVILIIVAAIVVIGVVAVVARMGMQRQALRSRFGDEYDRTVTDLGDRKAAETDLRQRQRDHDALQLKTLTDADKARYAQAWRTIQVQFVDDPTAAATAADQLVTQIAEERGYPSSEYSGRLKQLSVEHASALTHYRQAHDVAAGNETGSVATEDLRQALVHYRDFVAELLGGDADVLNATPSTNEPVGNTVAVSAVVPADASVVTSDELAASNETETSADAGLAEDDTFTDTAVPVETAGPLKFDDADEPDEPARLDADDAPERSTDSSDPVDVADPVDAAENDEPTSADPDVADVTRIRERSTQ